jgi:hypothetical protein
MTVCNALPRPVVTVRAVVSEAIVTVFARSALFALRGYE